MFYLHNLIDQIRVISAQ